jgi:hypothetical protein
MSSTRLPYDTSSYEAEITQSTNPLLYSTDPAYAGNCDRCYPQTGSGTTYPRNHKLAGNSRIEIENNLSSRLWKRDKHQIGGMSLDNFQDLAIQYEKEEVLEDCPMSSESQYSLLSDPRSNYRGLRTDGLVFATMDSYIQDGTRVPTVRNPGSVSSRDIAIDQYRKLVDSKKVCNKPDCEPVWPGGYQA